MDMGPSEFLLILTQNEKEIPNHAHHHNSKLYDRAHLENGF